MSNVRDIPCANCGRKRGTASIVCVHCGQNPNHDAAAARRESDAVLDASALFLVRNQNGTLLGEHATKAQAEADAAEYRRQTGNPATIEAI